MIGAGKGGTTSLHRWLAGHPQVFMSRIKETNYFAYEACEAAQDESVLPRGRPAFPVRSWDAYLELFRDAGDFTARGEASPTYLAWPSVPEAIAARLPGVRLVAVLRSPVDRAYSSYLMHARDGRERRSFEDAVRQELEGSADPGLSYGQLNYVRIGYYHQHLARYWAIFGPDRVHIELFDDLKRDPDGLLRRLCRFLGVDEGFEPDLSARLNPSGVPRSRLLAPLLRKNRVSRMARALLPRSLEPKAELAFDRWRSRRLVKPPLDSALRAELIERYREDISRLEDRLGRDLSAWREDRHGKESWAGSSS